MKVKLPVTEGLITRNHYKLRPIFSHSSVSGRGVTPSGLRKKHEKERKKAESTAGKQETKLLSAGVYLRLEEQ